MRTYSTTTTLQGSSKDVSYWYDTEGRRIKSVSLYDNLNNTGAIQPTTLYYYSGGRLMLERQSGSCDWPRDIYYTWGTAVDGSMETDVGALRSATGWLGWQQYQIPIYSMNNVVGWMDGSGAIANERKYGAYGELIAESGSQHLRLSTFGFQTQYQDQYTGLYHYLYRAKDDYGWLQEDPIEEAGGVNLYGYCNGNPLRSYDLWGQEIEVYLKTGGQKRFDGLPKDFVSEFVAFVRKNSTTIKHIEVFGHGTAMGDVVEGRLIFPRGQEFDTAGFVNTEQWILKHKSFFQDSRDWIDDGVFFEVYDKPIGRFVLNKTNKRIELTRLSIRVSIYGTNVDLMDLVNPSQGVDWLGCNTNPDGNAFSLTSVARNYVGSHGVNRYIKTLNKFGIRWTDAEALRKDQGEFRKQISGN